MRTEDRGRGPPMPTHGDLNLLGLNEQKTKKEAEHSMNWNTP